jgi:hypothetical protein
MFILFCQIKMMISSELILWGWLLPQGQPRLITRRPDVAPEAPESPQQRLQPPHAGLRAPLLVVGRWKHVDGESTNSSTLNRGVIIQTLNSWTRVITIMNINYWNHIESMAVVVGTQQIFSQNILSLFDFLNLRPVIIFFIKNIMKLL